MGKYICKIDSNSSTGRSYEVDTRSARKAAELYGRCEGGEVVTIETKGGKVLSSVKWSPEGGVGGRYYGNIL